MDKIVEDFFDKSTKLPAKFIAAVLILIVSAPFVYVFTLFGQVSPLTLVSLGALWAAALYLALFLGIKADKEISEHSKTKRKMRRNVDAANSFLLDNIVELRRPLQGLVGIRDLYGINPDNPETKEYMDVVDHCSLHLMSQLERLQFFSEVSLQNIARKDENFKIRELISESIKIVTSRLIGRSASVVKEFDSSVPEKAKGPLNLVLPLLSEAIDSALTASSSGQLKLKISRDSLAPQQLNIMIEDEKAFSPGLLKQMEDEISNIQSRHPWSGKSLGLGIPVLRAMVVQLGIRFWIQNNSNKQAICLSIPLTMDALKNEASDQERAKEVSTHFHLPSKRILIVDDEPLVRNLLSSLLHRLGQDVTVATNGHEAIELCRRHLFGVVFTDLDMPVINGWEATDTILNKLHLPNPPKIIALTSHARESDKKRGKELGMYAYLTKPVSSDQLKAVLEGLGLETKEKTTKQKDPEIEQERELCVDFNRMYSFYNEDYELCEKVLAQAKTSLPQIGSRIEKAIIEESMKRARHALHQLKGEFAVCMCSEGMSLCERMMSHENTTDMEFLVDFENINKLIDRAIMEIEELVETKNLAA